MNWRMGGWLWLLATLSLSVQAQTTVEYIHTDALGTPVAVTNSAGVVIERSEYEPYGTLLNRPLTDGPGFTGHVQDAATGLTYMQQRYYDPMCGCFLSVDPVAANPNTGASFNRYNYANNNPYKFKDPDGRQVAPVGLPPVRQEQMVPIPVTQKLKAAQDAAIPKTAYASGSLASARAGGPPLSGSAEVGKYTVTVGVGGVDGDASPGSARLDTPLGSVSTDGKPTSGVAGGAKATGPGVNIGVSNSMSAKAIANIPMTKIVTPFVSVAWGSDQKGNWAIEIGGGAKAQGGVERPKSNEE